MEGQERSSPHWDQLLPDFFIVFVKWGFFVSYLRRNVLLDEVSYTIDILDLASFGN